MSVSLFCSLEPAESLKSELVKRDGSRMTWNGIAGETSRRSSSSHLLFMILTLLLMSSREMPIKGALSWISTTISFTKPKRHLPPLEAA